jgi:PAS domain S-box-containing protein
LSGAAVARFDLEGRRTYANQALAEAAGTTPEKLIGGKLGDFNIPGDRERLWAAFRRCVATGKRATGLFTVCHEGGSLRHTRSVFTPIRDSGGSITGVQVTSVDITELVRARQRSQRAEELYRSLVEATGCVVVRLDGAGRRTFISKQGMALFETNVEEGTLGVFGDTMTDEGKKEAWALLRRVFETGEAVRGFVTRQTWKGQERHISSNLEPILDEAGKVVEVQVTHFDITDIKRDQEELDRYRHRLEDLVAQRTSELQRAMRQLEREVEQHRKTQDALRALSKRLVDVQELERRSIARELHDAIGQTLTALKLLLERAAGPALDPTKTLLRDARGLVQDLISHVRGVSLNLRPPMLDDLGLLSTLLWYFEQYTRQTGIAVKLSQKDMERHFGPDTEITAYRILQEALNNVARHSGAKEVEVDLKTSGDRLLISVRDNGNGFDPEWVVSYAGCTGLVGIRERASSLGGSVIVESAPGAGTRLIATLPLLKSAVGAVSSA